MSAVTFIDFCRAHGVVMDTLPREGLWRRYKTTDKPHHRNGAVKFMGDHGFVQNHATMIEVATWRADGDQRIQARPIDRAEMAAQRDRERAYRIQAMRGARAFWNKARPLRQPHPYIANKGLSAQGCAGLRTHGGLLIVPVWHGEWIISVQTITQDGQKRFWAGAPVKAGAYVLDRARAAVTAICEGLATGLAVYQCVRQARVIVAFDAGNLLPVIERVRPTGSVVVVGDNDHKTAKRIGTNPGIEKATNAASLIGAGVVWPTGIEGSDYADALKEIGEGAPRRIEREILAGARYVMGSGP